MDSKQNKYICRRTSPITGRQREMFNCQKPQLRRSRASDCSPRSLRNLCIGLPADLDSFRIQFGRIKYVIVGNPFPRNR